MMTVVKQRINTILLYIYYRYYNYRMVHDNRFRMREYIKEIEKNHARTLVKLAKYEKDFKWN